MNKVLNSILTIVAWIVTIVTFICLDIPLKILAIIFILLVGIVCAIIYPLTKNLSVPMWFGVVFDYSAEPKMLIAKKVYKLWTED